MCIERNGRTCSTGGFPTLRALEAMLFLERKACLGGTWDVERFELAQWKGHHDI
jgi:hypothetical protein